MQLPFSFFVASALRKGGFCTMAFVFWSLFLIVMALISKYGEKKSLIQDLLAGTKGGLV